LAKYIIKDVTYPGMHFYITAIFSLSIMTSNRREDAAEYDKEEAVKQLVILRNEIPKNNYKLELAQPGKPFIPDICHSTEERIFSAMQGGTD